jgi:hypothetical protein
LTPTVAADYADEEQPQMTQMTQIFGIVSRNGTLNTPGRRWYFGARHDPSTICVSLRYLWPF